MMRAVLIGSVTLMMGRLAAATTQREDALYDCGLCVFTAENAWESGNSFQHVCESLFGAAQMCEPFLLRHPDISSIAPSNARQFCQNLGACSDVSNLPPAHSMEQGLDIRVSKAYGSRGYDKVRLSVISNESISSEYFTYSELFKYRWTTNVLNTGLVTLTPGEKTTLTIAGQEVHIKIPREDEPVRGVVVADPCITSDYVWCTYREEFDTYNRSSELLNAIHSHEDTDFWMILGDNFYDPQGDATASWFATLSPETKSKVQDCFYLHL